MASAFASYGGELDAATIAASERIFHELLAPLRLRWSRRGTWIEAWNGERRIAVAPHRSRFSIYFKESETPGAYRELGGVCKQGRVSITLPLKGAYDAGLLRFVIAKSLGMSRVRRAAAANAWASPGTTRRRRRRASSRRR
jgi:hypothetical protein